MSRLPLAPSLVPSLFHPSSEELEFLLATVSSDEIELRRRILEVQTKYGAIVLLMWLKSFLHLY